ncbi:four helix bundle protein [Patescibacteria group bacterium]
MKIKSIVYYRAFDFANELIKTIEGFYIQPSYFKLKNQIIRSSTSVSANIIEAQNARSRLEFISFNQIALREAEETFHWLKVIEELDINQGFDLSSLKKENYEIIKMISALVSSAKNNLKLEHKKQKLSSTANKK